MADKATDFFDCFVDPALSEYNEAEAVLTRAVVYQEGDANDARELVLRRARTASIELHQFADRVLATAPNWAVGSTVVAIRQWLTLGFVRRVNGQPVDDLVILHDVADAFKHATLSRKVLHVKSDRAVISTSTGFGRLGWSEGKFGGVEQVIVELADGRQRALSLVLLTIRDAWASAMGRPRLLIGWDS